MNLLFCGCSCFSRDFIVYLTPSWIKHHIVIFTARCCIISIIHKACACNLIPSVIFTATKAGPEKWNCGDMCAFVASLYDLWLIHHQSCARRRRRRRGGGQTHCALLGVHIQCRLNYWFQNNAQWYGKLETCASTAGPVVSIVATRGWPCII